MIHVTQKEIQKAFRSHKNIVDTIGNQNCGTIKMVLFYAVECGLKALYMKNKRIERTDSKNESQVSVGDFGHDLKELLLKLNINLTIPKALAWIDKNQTQIEPDDLHQCWRYGKPLDIHKEKKCVTQLKNILKKLESELP